MPRDPHNHPRNEPPGSKVHPMRKVSPLVRKPAKSAAEEAVPSVARARVLAINADGTLRIKAIGSPRASVARVAVPLDRARLLAAIDAGEEVVVAFENGDLRAPIVVGALWNHIDNAAIVASVDGKRVKLSGKDEVVLECGNASITLRRNGRLIIKGAHVETVSEGTNRIKGGQVRIN
jgi:hypothetical protein